MARKIKVGIDYFPHSCELNDELMYIIGLHKETGYYVYFRLLEKLYHQYGYYAKWDKKNIVLFSEKINVDINKINDIIIDCFCGNIFDKRLHDEYKILTSEGIQKRYFEAIDRRKSADVISNYLLIDEKIFDTIKADINLISVDFNRINDNISTQIRKDKSKVNKSKVNNTYNETFEKFWLAYDRKGNKNKAYSQWKKLSKSDINEIRENIRGYIESTPDLKFRMDAQKYLNPKNKHWLDQPIQKGTYEY